VRIILIGQAAFGEKTLEKLVSKGEDVLAVYCPPDPAGGKLDPIKQKALALRIPVNQPKTFKDPQVQENFKSLNADLGILAFVSQIIPPPVFSAPRFGSLCYHPSLLPKHRGRSAINWTLLNGEHETGFTIFWLDQGIDTGPILLQKKVPIDPNDTTGSLYFNKLFPMGIEAMAEAVDLVKAGNPPRIVQDESQATYEPIFGDEHCAVDWSKPAGEVYNLIRASDPQPGAHTMFNGKVVRLFDARLASGANAASAGTVTGINAEDMTVALNGGTLAVKKARGEGAKSNAAEFARQAGLKIGDRLG
jgi:methionyl-tRNA formyltransferase